MDFICPYPCPCRTNSGYCGSTGGWERCQFRQLHEPNTVVGYVPPLKNTNADKIRKMSDEEMARWIARQTTEGGRPIPNEKYEWWLDWLKQEADSDG